MGINWNKRVKATPPTAVESFRSGVKHGKVILALLTHPLFVKVHAPLITKIAQWFAESSDTPVAEVEAIDEVFVTDEGMCAGFFFWNETKYAKNLSFTFVMDDDLCFVTRNEEDEQVRSAPLCVSGMAAGPQSLREFNWLEEEEDD